MAADVFDQDLIESIAAALDLRQPNREALESIVYETVYGDEVRVVLAAASGATFGPAGLVVEVKMDKEMPSADVAGKREAARRWANHVTADAQVTETWRYLLASESDVRTAKGSWLALRQLGS